MCSDQIVRNVVGIKFVSNSKSYNSWVVSSEEIFASRSQIPIVDFMKFFESFAGEMLLGPINCMIGWDSIIDEFEEGISETSASAEKGALHDKSY